MSTYSTSDVVELLAISPARVRSFVRQGFVTPSRGTRGGFRFSFQDLVLLRAARELLDANVPVRRVSRALRRLRETLPAGQPLSAVRIGAQGDRVVVRDGDAAWNPESGQVTFDFSVAEMASNVAPLTRRAADVADAQPDIDGEDWFELALDLEVVGELARAVKAYGEALARDGNNVDAHINLGRLLIGLGNKRDAMKHFERALALRPDDAIASYNLAVVLDDQKRYGEAIRYYRRAIRIDPDFADAHYNLAMLYEDEGNNRAALRHLSRYRNLLGRH